MIRHYDRWAIGGLRPSPYGWRVRLALAHKGLAAEEIAVTYADSPEVLAFSGQARTPVLVDGDATIVDSWEILRYLDRAYPARPAIADEAEALAWKRYAEEILESATFPLVAPHFPDVLAPQDRMWAVAAAM